jgi:L-2-hydroxyglutarate oxidase LhgO
MRAAVSAWVRHAPTTTARRARPAATAAALPPVIEADTVVVGAGVVGLATARALARRGREVLLLDARPAFGAGISSRSSEVVHAGEKKRGRSTKKQAACVHAFFFFFFRARPSRSRSHLLNLTPRPGLYYPPASLKARLCVAGAPALLAYAAARNVPHATPGKLIVAVKAQERAALAALARNAAATGVATLAALAPEEARALEPGLGPVVAALHSPTTAIIDSHALMAALLADAEAGGRTVFFPRAAVVGGVADRGGGGGGAALDVVLPDGPARVHARSVVLAAGLGTPRLAARLGGLAAGAVPPGAGQWVAKGSYFRLDPASSPRPPFTRLIYPLPADGGLGVHLTLDLGGSARFGPDVEWRAAEGLEGEGAQDAEAVLGPPGTADPAPSPRRAPAFAAAIRQWWPSLPATARLVPDYAGVRPKLAGPGEAAADFVVAGPAATGVRGVVALFGIESPGLTASLMLGEAAAAEACGDDDAGWRDGRRELDCGV